jgi:hypothetical protein
MPAGIRGQVKLCGLEHHVRCISVKLASAVRKTLSPGEKGTNL